MSRAKERMINEIVGSLRKQYGLSYPVDVDNLIANLHGKICESTFLDTTIKSKVRLNETFTITLSKRDDEDQFLLAKCLGHLILHLGFFAKTDPKEFIEYTDSPLYRQGYSEENLEATQFAQELLMPEDDFLKAYCEDNNLSHLAKVFGVTKDLVRDRCTWFGLQGGYCR